VLGLKERYLSGLFAIDGYLNFVGSVKGRLSKRSNVVPSSSATFDFKCSVTASSTAWSLSDTPTLLFENTYMNLVKGILQDLEGLADAFELWRALNVLQQGDATTQYVSDMFHRCGGR